MTTHTHTRRSKQKSDRATTLRVFICSSVRHAVCKTTPNGDGCRYCQFVWFDADLKLVKRMFKDVAGCTVRETPNGTIRVRFFCQRAFLAWAEKNEAYFTRFDAGVYVCMCVCVCVCVCARAHVSHTHAHTHHTHHAPHTHKHTHTRTHRPSGGQPASTARHTAGHRRL